MALKPLSFEAQQIIKRLESLKIGEMVTWTELDEMTGRKVRNSYYWIRTAQAALLRSGIVIEPDPGIGLRRLNAGDHVTVGEKGLRSSRLKATRTLRKLTALDKDQWESLPNGEKIRHNTIASMLGAVAHFSAPQKIKALESQLSDKRKIFDPQETLRALS